VITLDRDQVECPNSFEFLGIIVMDNQLKPITKDIIQELNESKFRSVIATGDNIFTAICVAKKCNILSRSNPMLYAHMIDYDHTYEKVIFWQIEQGDDHQKEEETPRVFPTYNERD